MKPFEHVNAESIDDALSWLDGGWKARLIAGGTDLLGEMKRGIIAPERLVNLNTVPGLRTIEDRANEGLYLGPLVTLQALADSSQAVSCPSVLSQAAASAASPQLRHMGTLGGNLCQRPRCWYYRGDFHCLRKGGRVCYATGGDNRYHAIFGGDPCFIVHPSDTAPALTALEAHLDLVSPEGARTVPIEDFFVSTRTDPYRENILRSNEILSQVQIPAPAEGSKGIYLKIRQRQSWTFALVSVAAQVVMDAGRCCKARIVLGGVAPTPWRAREAEALVEGSSLDAVTRESACRAATAGAEAMSDNAYKVTLVQSVVRHALSALAA